MTKVIGNTVIIEPEPEQTCELCGAFAECRPYGPNGEQICYECGMKDLEATKLAFERRLLDDNRYREIVISVVAGVPLETDDADD